MNKKYLQSFHFLLGGIAAIILFMGTLNIVNALTIRPPVSALNPGDITGLMIRDGTITNIDITSTSTISAFKIGQMASGSIPFQSTLGFNASSSELAFDTYRNFMTIGSSSPTQGASTSGLWVAGPTTVGSLVATGTALTYAGVPYTMPTTQGTASTLLTNNGSGALSWGAVSFGAGTTTNSGTFSIASTTGTSTAANGLNLTGGCFAKNGVCISFASQARQGISYASTSYLKVVSSGVGINSTYKQIAAPLPGGYYVRYSISASGGGGLCTLVWGIYINDVLRSEELSRVGYTADTQYIYSNQIYAVDSGDLIQLKIRHTTVDDCPVKYSEVFSIEGEVVPTTGAATTTIGFSN